MSRVKRSDGEATHSKILESAGKLIAKHGFAQTSNKMIAKKADVDLAAINYHFGGRDKLHSAVLAEAHRHFMDGTQLTTLAECDLPPIEKFEQLIDALLNNIQNNVGWASQVFFREMLSPSTQFDLFFKSDGAVKLHAIKRIICSVTNIPEDDPYASLCMLSVCAPCIMMLVTGKHIPSPVNAVVSMDKAILSEHFKKFSLAGLMVVSKK